MAVPKCNRKRYNSSSGVAFSFSQSQGVDGVEPELDVLVRGGPAAPERVQLGNRPAAGGKQPQTYRVGPGVVQLLELRCRLL
jgi:hypothetical protein